MRYKDQSNELILKILKEQWEYLRYLRKLPENMIDSELSRMMRDIEKLEEIFNLCKDKGQ